MIHLRKTTIKDDDGVISSIPNSTLTNNLFKIYKAPEKYRAAMIFDSIETARALFDGNVNALTCIGTGKIEMHGLVSMLDNVNRILDRVALYLA